jgi:tetratricopeptide (TPR) repeat protein
VSLRILAGQASRTLARLSAIAGSAEGSRIEDGAVGGDVRSLIGNVDLLNSQSNTPITIPQLSAAGDSDEQMTGVLTVLVDLFERIAKQHLKDQKTLRQIASALRESYEAPFLGMRNEAEKWLISGMKRAGRDRDEDFNDAIRLLRASLDSPFGTGDYVAWFQLGWLLWQHEHNLAGAEDAFYKAQRLTSAQADLYYIKSVRHLAYIQYLRGNYAVAYENIQKVLAIHPDHESRFECARYAAMLARESETIQLLEQCIRERPTTIIAMFAESDFFRAPEGTKLLTEMAELASRMLEQARQRTAKNLQHWRMGLMVVDSAEKMIGHKIPMPADVGAQALAHTSDVGQADYMTALEIDRRSLSAGDKVLHVARNVLKQEVRDSTSVLGKAQGELEKLEFARRRRITEAQDWKEEQIEEMPSLLKFLRGKSLALNLMFPIIGVLMELAGLPQVKRMFGIDMTGVTPDVSQYCVYLFYCTISWLIFSYFVFAIAQIFDVGLRHRQQLRIERVYEELLRVDEAKSSGELGALRKTVWEATRRKQRADEALRLIEPG